MKRWIKLTTLVAVPVLLVGAAGAYATDAPRALGFDDDAPLTGADRDRAVDAAIEHVGGGSAIHTERGDADSPHEVEVRADDGRRVEVDLDERFRVIGTDIDDDRDDDRGDGVDDRDDVLLPGADQDRAAAAAVKHVGSGTATDVEASDTGTGYEVEVRTAAGASVDVLLDDSFDVVTSRTDADDDRLDRD